MRVLVCGGRRFGLIPRGILRNTPQYYQATNAADREIALLNETLSLRDRPSAIIHGAQAGADYFAGRWARRNGVTELAFKADFYPNGRAGGLDRSQGPKRNQRMIDVGKPDLVIAFAGGAGTADMVKRARAAGIDVVEVK